MRRRHLSKELKMVEEWSIKNICKKSISECVESQCKGPETRVCLVWKRNTKEANMAEVKWGKEKDEAERHCQSHWTLRKMENTGRYRKINDGIWYVLCWKKAVRDWKGGGKESSYQASFNNLGEKQWWLEPDVGVEKLPDSGHMCRVKVESLGIPHRSDVAWRSKEDQNDAKVYGLNN